MARESISKLHIKPSTVKALQVLLISRSVQD